MNWIQIKTTLFRRFPPGARYLIGVSGGRDSIALLHCMVDLGYRKLIVCHFDHQLRGTGVKLVEIETREQLRRAVNDRTAMMHFTNFANAAGQIKVDEWPKLAKEYKVPCMNDAAADTPPVSHLWDYANMGYDLITFSGGKALRGPQCAGMLIGREDLVHYALLNNSPYEDTLGRRAARVGRRMWRWSGGHRQHG